jgi:ankyrin repeat protein
VSISQELTQAEVRAFVAGAHADLARVQALHRANPALLNARYHEWNETAIEAAAHMGARAIAEYLLAAGAPLTICTAAMLGQTDQVAAFLQADPAQAHARGAHGIPVLVHAALSGNCAVADLLVAYGGGEGLDEALIEAVTAGHVAMVAWLLGRGADAHGVNFEGKTLLRLALDQHHDEIVRLLWQHARSEEDP